MRLIAVILLGGLIWVSCSSHKPRQLDWKNLGQNPAPPPVAPLSAPASEVVTNMTTGTKISLLTITNEGQILTLADSRTGIIVAVNSTLRFVIIDYGLNLIPDKNQRVFVYRHNEKIGQVRITGPQRLGRIVADILEGEPQTDDEVRSD